MAHSPIARHLLFHKPYDVLCQFTDDSGQGRRTLKDYISVPGVYGVGRLDRDSEGLLLLTNHGPLQHRLSHPRFGHPRTYWVQVERIPDGSALERLRQGVTIQNYRTRPAQVELLAEAPIVADRDPPIRFRKSVPTRWLSLTLTEGRNRQVRRMTVAVGFPTLRLIRVAIGLPISSPPFRGKGNKPQERIQPNTSRTNARANSGANISVSGEYIWGKGTQGEKTGPPSKTNVSIDLRRTCSRTMARGNVSRATGFTKAPITPAPRTKP